MLDATMTSPFIVLFILFTAGKEGQWVCAFRMKTIVSDQLI